MEYIFNIFEHPSILYNLLYYWYFGIIYYIILVCIIVKLWSFCTERSKLMQDLKTSLEYYSKRLRELEKLPDDNPIKQEWKTGKISDTVAIYYLELNEYLEETP